MHPAVVLNKISPVAGLDLVPTVLEQSLVSCRIFLAPGFSAVYII